MADLDMLTVGMVMELFFEQSKDLREEDGGSVREATQDDFDKF